MLYGFDVLEMTTIWASTDAGNRASIRVLEKLGFQRFRRDTIAGLDTIFCELERSGFTRSAPPRGRSSGCKRPGQDPCPYRAAWDSNRRT